MPMLILTISVIGFNGDLISLRKQFCYDYQIISYIDLCLNFMFLFALIILYQLVKRTYPHCRMQERVRLDEILDAAD